MSKLSEIVSGWKNYVFKSEEHEKLAKDRIELCIECPEFSVAKRCKKCGCFMPAKVRSEKSNCPLGKW